MAAHRSANSIVPAHGAYAVATSDSADLPNGVTRSLYIGSTGNINVIMADGMTVLFPNVPVGFAPLQVIRILTTNTTASNIIALY